jgi:hypothetical protein
MRLHTHTNTHTNDILINTKFSYGFHGLSETLLKIDRSEAIENLELCFDD